MVVWGVSTEKRGCGLGGEMELGKRSFGVAVVVGERKHKDFY